MRRFDNGAGRSISVALAAALAFPGRLIQAERVDSGATVREPAAEDLARFADGVERVFGALAEAHRDLPRETFDPEAVLARVGRDPGRLFEWVRDETHWVPYRGALRGPIGVLMDRLGNSLDRSLLLGEMLRLAGFEVRLARGALTEAEAEGLLERIRPVPENWLEAVHAPAEQDPEQHIGRYAAQFGMDADDLRTHVRGGRVQAERIMEDVSQRVAEQVPRLAGLVGMPEAGRDPRPAIVAALRDHWWVQRRTAAGWEDLDVLLPSGAPGVAATRVQETVALDRNDGSLPLDDDRMHLVVVRVVVERGKDGALSEATVLEHPLRPAELVGERITLRQLPVAWPADLDLAGETDPAGKMEDVVLAQREWLPVLDVGSRRIFQSSFLDTGEVNETPNLDPAAEAAGRVRGIMGGLGGALAGPRPRQDPAQQGRLTAQWVEFEVRVPGQTPESIRREVFDFVGPAARATRAFGGGDLTRSQALVRGLNLLEARDLLVQPCQFSPQFVAHAVHGPMQEVGEFLLAVVRAGMRGDRVAMHRAPAPSQWGRLVGLAHARLAMAESRGMYLSRPNILAFVAYAVPGDGPSGTAWQAGFDLVASSVDVLPRPGADPFSARLAQGVLDSAMEAMLLDPSGHVGIMENTSERFQRWDAPEAAWVRIGPPDHEALAGLVDLPEDAVQRIRQDLAEGRVVVAPRRAFEAGEGAGVGWWRVNPETGETLGVTGRGTGGALSEYIKVGQALLGVGQFAYGSHRCLQPHGGPSSVCCLVMLGVSVFSFVGVGVYLRKAGWAFLFMVDTALFFMLPGANDLC